ncbi:MAG: acyltransferase family protein [Acidimicrobiales bacterium]
MLQARSVLVDGVWSVFFLANVHFAQVGTNYFSATTTTSPLQHFWSLAVEEQFYLVWPAVLGGVALLLRKRARAGVPRVGVAVVLMIAGAGSFYLSVTQTAANPTGAYFSTIDRAWELAVGAMLAVILPWLSRVPSYARALLSWGGIIAIVAAAVLFSVTTEIPGWKAMLPVLGCAGLLAGGVDAPRGGAHMLLAIAPLRFLGNISYSLYLWHWPVLIIAAAYLGASDTLLVRVILVLVSLILATLSYYGLENPLRRVKVLSSRAWRGLLLWPVATGLVVSLAVFAAPSVPFSAAAGPTNATITPAFAIAAAVNAALSNAPVPSATDPSLLAAPGDHVSLGDCSQYPNFDRKVCQLGDPKGTKTLAVFGDSHSVMWEPALAMIAKRHHWKFYAFVEEGCGYDTFTNIDNQWGPRNPCARVFAWSKMELAKLRPNVLVIGSYTGTVHWIQGETSVVQQLKPLVTRLILLSDDVVVTDPAPCLLGAGATQLTCLSPQGPPTLQDEASAIAATTEVNYLDIVPLLCDANYCPAVINGLIPTKDGKHLTPQYSQFVANELDTALNLNGTATLSIPSAALSAATPAG